MTFNSMIKKVMKVERIRTDGDIFVQKNIFLQTGKVKYEAGKMAPKSFMSLWTVQADTLEEVERLLAQKIAE